jgi:hypothetical protein
MLFIIMVCLIVGLAINGIILVIVTIPALGVWQGVTMDSLRFHPSTTR